MEKQVCAIGVMAKAPQPGRSKTRLCPPLTHDQAAAMSAAFLRDITENIACAARSVPIKGLIAYAPEGSAHLFAGHVAEGTGMVLAIGRQDMPQDVVGFGRCLLHAIDAMLGEGHAAACVVNSDSPTLPTSILEEAARLLLAPGERVVLGPAEDGGYYLLGMKHSYARLFADIEWSSETVAQATRERAAELGLALVELPMWYDVDNRAALERLIVEVGGERVDAGLEHYPAPASAAALGQLGRMLDHRQAAE